MDEHEVQTIWARGPQDVRAAAALRVRVFCDEQGVALDQELDGLDGDALHLIALQRGAAVVGTLRLFLFDREAKIGRVAVDRDWRHRGIASRMLAEALARSRSQGILRVRLAAQMNATAVYERSGFAVESDRFEQAGIAHVWMGLSLTE